MQIICNLSYCYLVSGYYICHHTNTQSTMNYEKTLRQLRAACFNYEGRKDEQCQRLIARCKQVLGYDRPSTEYTGIGRPAICPNVATD